MYIYIEIGKNRRYMSFCAVRFSRDVLDEVWDLIESVSEGFSTYFFICRYVHIYQ